MKRALPSALVIAGMMLAGCATTPTAAHLAGVTGQPAPKDSDAPGDLDSAIRQAQLKRVAGDLTGATFILSQLVLAAPDDPRVLGEYGKVLAAQGQNDEALAFLKRAIELQPNDWMLYSAQGVVLDQKAKYKEAQASYNKALALKPAEPAVLSNAALSYMLAGDLDTAESMLKQAAASGGDNPKIAGNLAMIQSMRTAKGLPAQPQYASVPAPQPASGPPAQTAEQISPDAMAAIVAAASTKGETKTAESGKSITVAPIAAPAAEQVPAEATGAPVPLEQPAAANLDQASAAPADGFAAAPVTDAPAPAAEAPAQPTGLAALQADPSVKMMAPIPDAVPAKKPAKRKPAAVQALASNDTGFLRKSKD